MRIATAHLSRGALIALAFSVLVAAVPSMVWAIPATPEIAAKEAEAAAAQVELDRMNAALEVQIEEYNAISEALDQTNLEVEATAGELATAQQQLSEAQSALASHATNIYKQGPGGVLDVFLGVRSFADFVTRLDLAARVGQSEANVVASVKDTKARVEASALALEQRRAEQSALKSDAKARAERIEEDVRAQRRFVSQLTAEVKTLIAAEEERQRRLAEERARQAALAAQAAAARKASTSAGRQAADPSTLGGGHPQVAAIALKFVGVPYQWGGSSPSGFDCSGLTQYSYRQVGISLPRTSQSQFQVGQHVSASRADLLQPGDLVFFGTDGDPGKVHHVGIYVGDGNYVHAPYTGAFVRVDSLTERISSRGDYVGASRI